MIDGGGKDPKKRDVAFVITKFMQKGYNSLTEEELAVTLINPTFNSLFKKQTGKTEFQQASTGSANTKSRLWRN